MFKCVAVFHYYISNIATHDFSWVTDIFVWKTSTLARIFLIIKKKIIVASSLRKSAHFRLRKKKKQKRQHKTIY